MNLNGGAPLVSHLRVYNALRPLPGPGPISPLMTGIYVAYLQYKSIYSMGIFDEQCQKFWLADWVM